MKYIKSLMLAVAFLFGTLALVACGPVTEKQNELIQLEKSCSKNPAQEACAILQQKV